MINIDTRDAERKLQALKDQLSSAKVTAATRMTLNEGVRKARTEIRRTILEAYTIKSSRINDPNKKKGLSTKLASGKNLSAEVDAGHIPINLSEANPKFKGEAVAQRVSFNKKGKAVRGRLIQRSKTQISVEVIKGERKTLETAFTIGRGTNVSTGQQFSTPAIFARGKKGKPRFKFGKDRLPIDSLSTISVATAATNMKAQAKVQPVVSRHVEQRMEYHLKRMIKG